jgi:hypothetical protein
LLLHNPNSTSGLTHHERTTPHRRKCKAQLPLRLRGSRCVDHPARTDHERGGTDS